MIERDVLISIGVMKCGTTWLAHNLKANRHFNFSFEKEIHYFPYKYGRVRVLSHEARLKRFLRHLAAAKSDTRTTPEDTRRLIAWYCRFAEPIADDRWFCSLFEKRDVKNYICDFGNYSALLKAEDYQDIMKTVANPRFVLTLRNPSDRLWSNIVFNDRFRGQETDFSEFTEADFQEYVDRHQIMRAARYRDIVSAMKSALPQNAYRIFVYNELFERPIEGLQAIEDLCDVPRAIYPQNMTAQRVNASPKLERPAAFVSFAREVEARELDLLANVDASLASRCQKHTVQPA